jgi:hypothetical protein
LEEKMEVATYALGLWQEYINTLKPKEDDK